MSNKDQQPNVTQSGSEPAHLTKEEMRQKIKASLAAKEGIPSQSGSSRSAQTEKGVRRQEETSSVSSTSASRSSGSYSYGSASPRSQSAETGRSQTSSSQRSPQQRESSYAATSGTGASRSHASAGSSRSASSAPSRPVRQTPPRQHHNANPVKQHSAALPFLVAGASLVAALLLVYIGGIVVYQGKFLPNTFVNGVNIGGMTAEEAETAILQTAQDSGLTFLPRSGDAIVFKGSSFGCKVALPANALSEAEEESHGTWFKKLFASSDYVADLEESYSEADVASLIAAYDWGNVPPTDATVVQNADGTFSIQAEDDGNMVDTQVLSDYTLEQMRQGNNTISMTASNCYKTASVTAADLEDTLDLYNQIGSVEMVYDMTDREECMDPVGTETLDNATIMSWITTENGEIEVDEDAATAWIQENIADKYDTLVTGYVRTFKATMDGTIQLPIGEDGIYGWKTNVSETVAKLVNRIKNGESATVEPVYKVEGFRMNSNSGVVYTGDTYIEVDICNQKLWYYVNGELFLESDVVTGLASDEERATPPGAYMVWSRESPRKLGTYAVQGYETWVSYWMPVTYTGIGLHDLSRTAYGGDIYLTNGSHGCINLPLDIAKQIYDEVTINTPCMIIP